MNFLTRSGDDTVYHPDAGCVGLIVVRPQILYRVGERRPPPTPLRRRPRCAGRQPLFKNKLTRGGIMERLIGSKKKCSEWSFGYTDSHIQRL